MNAKKKQKARLIFKSRELSQIFLVDREFIEKTADALPLKNKTVLEIGAGTGILTQALARRAKRVIALEIDSRLREQLLKRVKEFNNVEVNFVDARKFNFAGFKTVFGNLPYHASTPLLFKILESGFEEAVLCLQKEFAERLVARPGSRDWSRLSVAAQANADVKILFEIPRFAFTPVPKVDS
ncbi:ribosomal RNA small subunit methyltransferase A, partial [Candidatus Micrarchaeota archaeon]|nr:ribosomal RNA small subunit methyltransferase A [Candidatus Micrarchaeota archaeon]